MMFGVRTLLAMVVASPTVGGLEKGFTRMTEYMQQKGITPMSPQSAVSLVATILMTSFGTWGLPQMIHKYYGIRDERKRLGVVL